MTFIIYMHVRTIPLNILNHARAHYTIVNLKSRTCALYHCISSIAHYTIVYLQSPTSHAIQRRHCQIIATKDAASVLNSNRQKVSGPRGLKKTNNKKLKDAHLCQILRLPMESLPFTVLSVLHKLIGVKGGLSLVPKPADG